MSVSSFRINLSTWVPFLVLIRFVQGHDHHDAIPEGFLISEDPIDAILWMHIFLMIIAFGLIFPTGMVLGLVRSRWHVPTQIVGTCLTIVGFILGHVHKGRKFAPNVHASFAGYLLAILGTQIVFGFYLKLHLEKGFHGTVRPYLVALHGILGKVMPVAAWMQMIFGGVTAVGFCGGNHLSQCLNHFALGSSLIGYGVVMSITLIAGRALLKSTGRTQEFWESLYIGVWGFFTTVTVHAWGESWSYEEIQYTATGILWWCAGVLGVWLSYGPKGAPRRNLIPALVLSLTGFAMTAWQPKDQLIAKTAYSVFGYTLMAAGLTRIIEISFVLRDKVSLPRGGISSFQYLPPFFLYAAGFVYQSATEEQLALIDESRRVDEVAYLLLMFAVSFIMFLLTLLLIKIYVSYQPKPTLKKTVVGIGRRGTPAGRSRDEEQREVADATEFELEELVNEHDAEARRLVPPTSDPEGGVQVERS